ncbi:MAG: molecular chaperone DnaJ, partial [Streptosporangiaceae bacterium]
MTRHEPIRGDIANLYPVGQGLLKVARDPADNDLMLREAIALALLRDRVEAPFQAYFPQLVEARLHREPRSGIQRHLNLIGRLTGFRSLAEVRAAFPAGIDPRDA